MPKYTVSAWNRQKSSSYKRVVDTFIAVNIQTAIDQVYTNLPVNKYHYETEIIERRHAKILVGHKTIIEINAWWDE